MSEETGPEASAASLAKTESYPLTQRGSPKPQPRTRRSPSRPLRAPRSYTYRRSWVKPPPTPTPTTTPLECLSGSISWAGCRDGDRCTALLYPFVFSCVHSCSLASLQPPPCVEAPARSLYMNSLVRAGRQRPGHAFHMCAVHVTVTHFHESAREACTNGLHSPSPTSPFLQ